MNVAAPTPGIDPTTVAKQAAASDPRRSVWVSANAGSGKTYVLALRVVRLLLHGADPARLLCLTFTKAAAAEMAQRVFRILAQWVRLDDAALDAELLKLEGRHPSARQRADARKLFARALETPGGLKIQTVHAFCERLLHQFPFEANVAGHFQVLEENAANIMIRDARRSVLAAAATDLSSTLGEALQTVVLAASDRSHEEAVAELVENRQLLDRWVRQAGSLDAALAQLRDELGVAGTPSPAAVEARILGEAALSEEEIRALLRELERTGSSNDSKAAARLSPYLTAIDEAARLAAYRGFFCKSDGGVRKASSLVTAKVRNAIPDIDEKLAGECRRIEHLLEQVSAAECYVASAAALRLAAAVIAHYEREKTARGFLDFDDLIVKTLGLLSRSEAARWVHYKIDQGLDHILLDEAQDTSPGQWQVIQALAGEFFAGQGAAPGTRTLFAVGDEKQSIYSFQGAVPAWFTRVRAVIEASATAAGEAFSDINLTVSFRSTPDIVAAVDRVFEPALAHTGLATEARQPVHEAFRRNEPGMVVVWPMVELPDPVVPGEWHDPLDHIGDAAPEMILARRIATTIRGWLDGGERLAATGKRIRPGGILILTRKRGPLSEGINRALKAAGVPVAGTDRLALADHIAVRDVIALGDAVLQDRDDLSLAAVLKSPLFGLSEEALYALAHDREGKSLWRVLREFKDAEPFESAYQLLEALRGRADTVRPFAFYADVLGPRQGRRKFVSRLGVEADDVLDEFLAQALVYERIETPSLQGFLAWMRSTATEIRRETELIRDEVRVMTVHGAKGLEADVVFLVDDGSTPAHSGHDPAFVAITDDPDSAEPAPLVWTRSARKTPPQIKALIDRTRERARQEYRRLLYVGLTRARDRLYVCGTMNQNTDRAMGWHALVSAALLPSATAATAVDGSEEYVWTAGDFPTAPAAEESALAEAELEPPAWLRRNAPTSRAIRAVRPSAVVPDAGPVEAAEEALAARRQGTLLALERGHLIHRMLEALPEQDPAERPAIARRYLAAVAPLRSEAEREDLMREALALLDDQRFGAVFADGSRAEVDIAAEIETPTGPVAVAGRIDRLAITQREILIVDYKTNRPAPRTLGAVSEGYVNQLALYREVLGRLYPTRRVAAALLFTDTPELIEIPADRLNKAMLKILGQEEPPF
ncbi:MAG: double-strand break repair helicase AddA [Bauldia sp.]